jgi:hypothetical protein
MTMRLTITNEGPEKYAAFIDREDGMRPVILQPGGRTEVYCWKAGGSIIIREVASISALSADGHDMSGSVEQ